MRVSGGLSVVLDEAYAHWSLLKLRASEIRVIQGVGVVPLLLMACSSGIFFFLLFLFLLFLVSVSVVAAVVALFCEALFFPQRTVTNSGGK